jgi:hypothetical protein
MTTQLEIESKFDAEPGQALPDLVGVAGSSPPLPRPRWC